MYLTKTRLIVGDLFFVVGLALVLWAIFYSKQNELAFELITLVLLGRSVFFHYNWYKTTGKIY